jgi:iron complex outermembrane receptor protein
MNDSNTLAPHLKAILATSLLGMVPPVGLAADSAADATTEATQFSAAAESPDASSRGAAKTLDAVSVTGARRREETAQEVPIPLTVLGGETLTQKGAYNVSRLQNLVPTLQFYSSNPRNTAVNIRGLGQPYGLTNDGIESGVGFYVDGVLYARPASTTLDFIDVERIEVLRGPQGTLFGKNTTAGAILVTTRKPSFTREVDVELGIGNYGFHQSKASLSGPISESLAGRLSFSGTQRDGVIYNIASQRPLNELDNVGGRGQLLFLPTDATEVLFAVDFTRQRPEGYAQVLAGVAPTYRGSPGFASSLYDIAPNPNANPRRHFWGIISDLGYTPPNVNTATREVRPYDRVIDTGTPWRSGNEIGGASLNIDSQIWSGTLTSTTAWRFWNWDPSNDRDYTALRVGTLSQAPSKHEQFTQEIRWAGDLSSRLSAVFGVYGFAQKLETDPVHTEEVGADYFRFVWNPSPGPNGSPNIALWGPGGSVVDNYFAGQRSEITSQLDTFSTAVFSQLDWAISERLHLLPGLRLNYDKKEVDFQQRAVNVRPVPAGSPTPPAPVYSNQTALREDDDTNVSGQLTLAYKASENLNYYANYATAFKSIGINLGGGPAIEIPPEDVRHIEIGLKSSPLPGVQANLTAYNTDIENYQTQVLVVGNPRPVIASAEKVRVRGIEFDGSWNVGDALSLYTALAYTDGRYVSFPNAPLPLELTGYTGPSGLPQVDVSGLRLPGISKWSGSLGGEYRAQTTFFGEDGELFTGVDLFYRGDFSSSATPSEFLNVPGYSLVNLSLGFRSNADWSVYLWARNALDKDYIELLQPAPAGQGAGHYGAQLGDPRAYGLTLRFTY